MRRALCAAPLARPAETSFYLCYVIPASSTNLEMCLRREEPALLAGLPLSAARRSLSDVHSPSRTTSPPSPSPA